MATKAQADSAKAQGEYQNRLYTETSQNALDSYRIGISGLQAREAEEFAAASAQTEAEIRGIRRESAAARTAAAAGGVSGNVVEDLMSSFKAVEGQTAFNINRNFRWTQSQLDTEKLSLYGNTRSRIAGAAPGPITSPNLIGLGLDIAGAGIGAYDSYERRRPPGGGK